MADHSEPGCSGIQLRKRKSPELGIQQIDEYLQNLESDEDISVNFSSSDNSEYESEDSDSEEEKVQTADKSRPKRARMQSLFAWSSVPLQPVVHNFDSSLSGINLRRFKPEEETRELDFFKQMLSEEIVEKVVSETNRYGSQLIESSDPLPQHSLLSSWSATSVNEMYVFFALTMLMVRNKKLALHEYWSKDWLLHSEAFSSVMPRNRYYSILRLLHFSDNSVQPQGDRLYKVRDILFLLKSNFKSVFKPYQNMCIDESLVLFKGRLLFKQYIRTKRHRFGIKLFVLCDVKTEYILDHIVYTGKETDINIVENLGISGSIVMTLMQPYLDKGHSLYTDNWYTSPLLSQQLHSHQTNSCGTVNKNRREMPKFDERKKLKTGDCESMYADSMMALRWKDKREVRMLSTIHEDKMKETEKVNRTTQERIKKPECVIDYNQNMGSVDRSDMMLSSVECVRKTMKWYKKLFFHFIDICLLNSHSLYQLHKGVKVPLASFQLEIIRQLLEEYHTPKRLSRGSTTADMPLRLSERHFPSAVPSTETRKNAARKCYVCSHTMLGPKKRKESRYMCAECDVGLCIVPCFRNYHTLKKILKWVILLRKIII